MTRLIWITPDAERLIAYIARVSNPAGQENEKYTGLLKYLVKNGHWSPFEMASACFEIETSRAIAAQMIRHRSFSFQEFSQRYAPVQEIETVEMRQPHPTNRQLSLDFENPLAEDIVSEINSHLKSSSDLYNRLITDHGVARETARFILPMASKTRIYMSGTIRSWIHYCQLRMSNGTQKEHSEIASEIWKKLLIELPFLEHI